MFEVIDEYSDQSNNNFALTRSNMQQSELTGDPPVQKDTANEHLPAVEFFDPVAMQDDFHKFLDGELRTGEKTKEKVKEGHYETKDADAATNAAIDNKVPVVVRVGATWCGPCQGMEKNYWPGTEKDFKGKAAFIHLDGDEVIGDKKGGPNAQAMAKGVESYPTIRVMQPTRNQDGSVSWKQLYQYEAPKESEKWTAQQATDHRNNAITDYLKKTLK